MLLYSIKFIKHPLLLEQYRLKSGQEGGANIYLFIDFRDLETFDCSQAPVLIHLNYLKKVIYENTR